MHTLYLVCAAVGATILVCQFILTLIGLGAEAADMVGPETHIPDDLDDIHPHSDHWLFGMLSFRTLTAFTAFFGLGGLAGESASFSGSETAGLAMLAGSAAFFGVAWLMKQLTRLNADGTILSEEAVGESGTVYLRIPANGQGKVQVIVREQVLEFTARSSAGHELPTGSSIRIVGLLGPDIVDVIPLEEVPGHRHTGQERMVVPG